ncbi:MAG: LruC domain-containing protein, partial [Bacteroidales bacterium]|nr:LruC domain-containing protein [Bacteroidales bacterium]
SHDVEFLITADHTTVINITSEDGTIQYHKGFYSQLPDAYEVKINLPTYVQRVLVNGVSTSVTGTIIEIPLSSTSFSLVKKRSARSFSSSGLLAAWHFDENSGNTANDALGIHNGTFTGAAWVTGISGSSLEFNGSTSSVIVPNNTFFNPIGDKISFSFWFKLPEVGASGSFIYQNTKYNVRIDPQGRVSFAVYTPDWKSLVMNYADRILNTDWHHVAATYDGATMKLFIDGVLKTSVANTGTLKSSQADFVIGIKGVTDPYKGTIDEILVYEKALTQEEITEIYSTTRNTSSGSDNLISAWELNENGGTIATDKQGVSNGTISNATWGGGIYGSCLNFNGTNSYVIIPSAEKLKPTDAMTMMAWVKTKENKSAKILEKGDWDGHGIGIDKWGGWQVSIRMEGNTTTHLLTWGGGLPILNEWYHLALTYDGSILKMYVNGQLKNSKAVTGKLNVNDRNICIGSNNGTQKFFNGSVDEVKIFGKALDQTQIQTHFNNQVVSSDLDGDGVPDMDDTYPKDPARAFHNYYPAEGFGSIAFEDLWPNKGDYDFNDLVVDYRFTIVTNSANKVTEVLSSFVVKAIGAQYTNGFGFQLPGATLRSSDIHVEGCKLFDNYITLNANGTEANQDKITMIVFDDSYKVMLSTAGFGINVIPENPYVKPDTMVVNIGFTPGVYTIHDLDLNNFNPFLIVDKNRGKEIHLPNYLPTSLVNQSYFGTGDDHSNPASGVYYKSAENLPWAIKIASSFDYTIEGVMVTNAHLKFKKWAESSGLDFPDWYLNHSDYRNESMIYRIP